MDTGSSCSTVLTSLQQNCLALWHHNMICAVENLTNMMLEVNHP